MGYVRPEPGLRGGPRRERLTQHKPDRPTHLNRSEIKKDAFKPRDFQGAPRQDAVEIAPHDGKKISHEGQLQFRSRIVDQCEIGGRSCYRLHCRQQATISGWVSPLSAVPHAEIRSRRLGPVESVGTGRQARGATRRGRRGAADRDACGGGYRGDRGRAAQPTRRPAASRPCLANLREGPCRRLPEARPPAVLRYVVRRVAGGAGAILERRAPARIGLDRDRGDPARRSAAPPPALGGHRLRKSRGIPTRRRRAASTTSSANPPPATATGSMPPPAIAESSSARR